MLLPHGTMVALIDGQNFALFRNAGTEAAARLETVPAPRLDSSNRSGAGHHSSRGNPCDSLVSEDAHAIAVVEWLNNQARDNAFEFLVVIAPARTLGEMRHHYHKVLERALLREVVKDITGSTGPEVLAALHA